MTFHALNGITGITAHDGALAFGTQNIDLTTEDDGVTASGVPDSVRSVVTLGMSTTVAGVYAFSDDTYEPSRVSPYAGPNICGREANVENIVKVVTENDGTVDLYVAAPATVTIVVYGYEECTSYNTLEAIDSISVSCALRQSTLSVVDMVLDGGQGWHKLRVSMSAGTVLGCVSAAPAGTYDYDADDMRFAVADLDAYVPDFTDDLGGNSDRFGAGHATHFGTSSRASHISAVSNSDGEIGFGVRQNFNSTFHPAA